MLDDLFRLRDLSEDDLLAELGATAGDVRRSSSYGKLSNVDWLRVPAAHPAHFYLREGSVFLVHVEDSALMSRVKADDLRRRLGGKGPTEQSPACKPCRLEIHAEKGVAFSYNGDDVDFIEIFHPMSHGDYLSSIYEKPGPFKR